MNVTFHTIASIATAAALSFKPTKEPTKSFVIFRCIIGFLIGILIHGVLDFLPHEYPFGAAFDVLFALILLALVLVLTPNQNRILICACFIGGIFPDLIDLSPAILNKYLGIPIFQPYKIFPWHWKEFSGSIYDRSKRIESTLFHALLLLVSGILLYFKRRQFFNFVKISK